MSREVYEDLKSGKIAEKDFHAGLILPVGATQADVLYVSEICALSDRLAKSMLIKDMQRYIKYLLQKSPAVKLVATWGYTKIGRKIAVQMGLTATSPSGRNDSGYYEIDRARALVAMKVIKSFDPVWSVPI